MATPVSHGRGGAANIKPDDTPYADGEIVREGPIGDQGDGAYSSGRGGAGNIDVHAGRPVVASTGDEDIVPDTATRLAREESAHYGRGGAGNTAHVHQDKAEQHGWGSKTEGGQHTGLVDKVKGIFHKEK